MKLILSTIGLALAATTLATPAAAAPAPAAPAPAAPAPATGVDPSRFQHPRENAYFPLKPGNRTRLVGSDGPEKLVEIVSVTHRTRRILGVRTTVVRDVVRRADGTLAESTWDWYAADNHGTVWYFGERTATFDEEGRLESREGSWQAGVDGARPGILLPAHPHAGQAYRQEFLRGHAEDQGWVVGNDDRVSVPLGDLDHLVRTFEWTRLEPGVMSLKLYAKGVGIVRERDVAGGVEQFDAVQHRAG